VHVDSSTLRGARVVGILCALLLIAPIGVSLAFPSAFFYAPYHLAYQRMLGALLIALGIGTLLALRDPVRNAGVFAVIGLSVGSLMAAIVYTLLVDGADPVHWLTQVPLLLVVSVALVVTYTRLRRPHPIVVRIVTAAVLLLPFGLYLYDVAYKAFVGR
jgi:4-amino-4-deoxy-L-arabinose transferase-like glycosyltransferase